MKATIVRYMLKYNFRPVDVICLQRILGTF